MMKILKWVFWTIAAWEAVLLLADWGPEVMETKMLSFEEVRMGIMLAALLCLCFLEVMTDAES